MKCNKCKIDVPKDYIRKIPKDNRLYCQECAEQIYFSRMKIPKSCNRCKRLRSITLDEELHGIDTTQVCTWYPAMRNMIACIDYEGNR